MSRDEEIETTLKATYHNLLEQVFRGTVIDQWRGYEKVWDRIQVDQADPIMDKLREVQDEFQGKVWKGFTGEEDGYTDFCLYVDLAGDGQGEAFKIVNLFPFPLNKTKSYSLNYGMRMVVERQGFPEKLCDFQHTKI